jgi:hypothetical protein
MTTTNPDSGLIKVDCLGRVRTTPQHRVALLAAFESSALGGPEFCRHHGINYQTFATWLQKHRRATGAYPPDVPSPSPPLLTLAEVELPENGGLSGVVAEAIEIRLPGGTSLLLESVNQLPLVTALLRELTDPRPC